MTKNHMRLRFRRWVRGLVLRAKWYTDRWVTPKHLVRLVDDEKWSEAKEAVEEARALYPDDPEITFYSTLIEFARGEE